SSRTDQTFPSSCTAQSPASARMVCPESDVHVHGALRCSAVTVPTRVKDCHRGRGRKANGRRLHRVPARLRTTAFSRAGVLSTTDQSTSLSWIFRESSRGLPYFQPLRR